jgi:hypothetical protein
MAGFIHIQAGLLRQVFKQFIVPNSKPILPTTRQGYNVKWPLPPSKILLSATYRSQIRS